MARPSNQEKSQPPTGTAAPSATSSSKPDTTAILLATGHTHKQDTEGHRVRCVPDQAAKDSLTRPTETEEIQRDLGQARLGTQAGIRRASPGRHGRWSRTF